MKKKLVAVLTAAALIVSLCIAASAEYGSADDPLVSLSYITNTLLPQIYTKVDEKIAASKTSSSPSTGNSSSVTYEPIMLAQGKKIEAASGSIEVLLRRGTFVAIDPLGDHLINMTQGNEAGEGEILVLQNLYVIARPDGRAIEAKTDSWIMVRGDYKIS